MTSVFQAGTAKVDITPPLTIPYLGYEPRHAFFHGVHDPLYARALAVDSGETQAVLITADSIGFSNDILGPGRHLTREVRQRIQQRTGVPAEHVMLTSSHAHSTPETINLRRLLDTSAAGPWLEVLMDQLTSAASMAVEHRRPRTLKIGTGELHGLAWSRRIIGKNGGIYQWCNRPPDDEIADWGTIDHQVGVLMLEASEGETCIVLSTFACHPVTVQVQPLVSADFPGAAMELVERALPGCESSLFLQGAAGDQNPVRSTTHDFNDVKRYGLMLGGAVLNVVGRVSAPDYPESRPVVAVASAVVSLPVRDLPPRGPAQRAYEEADRGLVEAATEGERERFARERRLVEEMLILIDRGTEPIQAEVQVMRIGDAALVALPGEPFAGLGLDIKGRSVAPYPFIVGYANDWLGYLATPIAWEQGGYEVGYGPWARVGPEGGPLLVEKAVELIRDLFRPLEQ